MAMPDHMMIPCLASVCFSQDRTSQCAHTANAKAPIPTSSSTTRSAIITHVPVMERLSNASEKVSDDEADDITTIYYRHIGMRNISVVLQELVQRDGAQQGSKA